MLLTIDVGNTNTVLGIYRGSELLRHWRIQTEPERTVDEYGVLLRGLFGAAAMEPRIDGAIISCVVPPMQKTVEAVCREYLKVEPLAVGPGIKTGMPILYDNPKEVGADRIVNAVAAYERARDTTIVVDFGTATTFDYISARGEYVGGVITPGPGISLEALYQRAAKLYRVEIAKPPRVVGRNTIHAIQSGIVYGYVSMVDGLVRRIRDESGVGARVFATGGFAALLAPESETIDEVDEFLTLDGLRILYGRNR
ncbi:MAG: type III pantothenate kinase [Deltaproteobacteria bacterium]|nr:type III pantothenate kinase [Deltaproteobacteria bacterium]